MNPPSLEIRALTRRFGAFTAVDDISLTVAAGETFALLGINGAGKSTAIKMLVTLLPPTSGDAMIMGHSILTSPDAVRRSIGYVPQGVSVDGSLTAYENLLIFAKLYDVPGSEREQRIQESLAAMDLKDDGARLVNQYSGGMVRRLEIALATLHRPQILFLDEPTVGLDPIARDAVWKRLLELKSSNNTTLIFTTHYLEEAQSYCDRIAIMQQGKITALGTTADLETSLGSSGSTLSDVFLHYAASSRSPGGDFHRIAQERFTAQRLG